MVHIPKPFKRPVIPTAGAHGTHGKSWQDIPARLVEVGDIIPDAGEVTHLNHHETSMDDSRVTLRFFSGNTVVYAPDQPVRAFGPTRG